MRSLHLKDTDMTAQTESTPMPTAAKFKEWLTLASVVVDGMKLVIAPLQTDIRAIHGRLDRMDGHIQQVDGHIRGLDHSTQNDFKTVREDISALSEGLIRLEILLEQAISRPDTPR